MDLNSFTLQYTDLYSVYAAMAVLALVLLSSVKSRQPDAFVSKDNSDFLKGFSILLVVIHHTVQRCHVDDTPLNEMIGGLNDVAGAIAVGVFFFLSGYGMSASRRTDLSFPSFLKIKLFRLYAPCLVVNFVVASILEKHMLMSLWPIVLDNTQWFVVLILWFCVLDYVAIRLQVGTWAIYLVIALWVVVARQQQIGIWWYLSSMCFPLGYTWQRNAAFITRIVSRRFELAYLSSIMLLIASYFIQKSHVSWGIVSAMVFCLCIMLMVAKWNPTNRGMKIIGRASLEIFVLHMKLAWILVYLADGKPTNSFPLAVYFVCVIAAGIGFSKLNQAILTRLRSRHGLAAQPT